MIKTLDKNPLLDNCPLPAFNEIETKHMEPGVKNILNQAEEKLTTLENSYELSWSSLMNTLDEIHVMIHNVWSPISHLHSVKNTPELREVFQKMIEPIVSFSLRLEQSQKIYKGLCQLKDSPDFKNFNTSQKRILQQKILNAKLSGIDLSETDKEIFNKNAKALSQLQTTFSNNVLDATKGYHLEVTDPKDLKGLPDAYLELASEAYNQKVKNSNQKSSKEKGPWLVTLDHPSFGPFIENSPNSSLRKDLYLAFIKRASSGKHNNTENINQILKLRQEQAKILGFSSYAELSLATKMAKDVSQIYDLSQDLLEPSQKKAKIELEEIKNFARKNSNDEGFYHWDVAYWSKRLQEKKFSYKENELKPYFSFEKVTKGLFDLAHNLFSITVKEESDKTIQVWDEHVKFYHIYDESNQHIASFYLDPYSRPHNKRGGAWMDTCVVRRKTATGEIILPVAYLVCNFTPPSKTQPSLLTFREVETIFHEFGHGLQHMLTKVDYLEASGINGVEWDAVELPSQFMENWCYHKKTLMNMAKHYESGEQLPDKLYQNLLDSKNYMVASQMLRQLQFALIDLHLHHDYNAFENSDPFAIQKEIANNILIMKPLEEDRFLCSFGHIFAGGYSAGYYSYKWAEVLSADAFSAFEEVDMEDLAALKKIGSKFKDTILGLGGSDDPVKIFKQFRGREPNVTALLKHSGLI